MSLTHLTPGSSDPDPRCSCCGVLLQPQELSICDRCIKQPPVKQARQEDRKTEEEVLYIAAFDSLNALSKLYTQTNKPKMYEVNKALHLLMDIQP